jgi:hypothetical protein
VTAATAVRRADDRRGVDPLGSAVEPRVHAAGRSGERIDVQCRHTRSAGERGRDGDDAAAAADVQDIETRNDRRVVQDVAGE